MVLLVGSGEAVELSRRYSLDGEVTHSEVAGADLGRDSCHLGV
jgi:hypothetical protein